MHLDLGGAVQSGECFGDDLAQVRADGAGGDGAGVEVGHRQDVVDQGREAAGCSERLVDDILAMANFDSGTIATRPVRADLREVITEALAGLHGASRSRCTSTLAG